MEVTDFLNGLDKIIEHDARTLGEQQMQCTVLRWAVAHTDFLSPLLRDSLIDCMAHEVERMKAERPRSQVPA